MTRLAGKLEELRRRNDKALVCFVTAGDPSLDQTAGIVSSLHHAGADVVELGVPFSDPLADGPSVQASSQRALDNGTTVAATLEIARDIRRDCPGLPLVLMTYTNPILHYGLERYAADAASAGVDGHIVTDLTPEEAGEWKDISARSGLDTIFLLAPTSTPARISAVCRLSTGFVYCVSRTGVTGARKDVPEELKEVVAAIKRETTLPVLVGFGVSEPQHVRKIGEFADGAVVGSALVDLIHRNAGSPDLHAEIGRFVSSLKAPARREM